jgi:predicted nucleic acid-binding protein
MDDALAAVSDLLALAGMQPLAELADHSVLLGELLTASKVTGAKVHDARVAAICLSNGVDTLWTADRDFRFFPSLHTANPLLA